MPPRFVANDAVLAALGCDVTADGWVLTVPRQARSGRRALAGAPGGTRRAPANIAGGSVAQSRDEKSD